ncbi:hypothetical protein [Chitinimonas lacunae]|uniref:Uncharacterized protein n=1 Tax=Chitinimonas lacunae TaxID=1963018 RepID=A0ABV8MKF3_9NEIS
MTTAREARFEAEAIWAAQGIRAYLAERPQAADTRDGIIRWWLGALWCDPRAVQRALDRLVAAGELELYLLPSGQALYRAAQNPGVESTS